MALVPTYPLNQSLLYRVTTRKKLAQEVFGVELPFLERFADRDNYHRFDVNKGTKPRRVEVPKAAMQRMHRRVFSLLERMRKPDYLHSGVKGRSYITNAKVHVGNVPLVKLDIQKFFPSIDGGRVYRFFNEELRCSEDVSGLLRKLLTVDGHVPTGSCVSQLLAFFGAKPLFDELDELARRRHLRYSCYVDDITFSGAGASNGFLWEAKKVVHRHGLRYHKDHCYQAHVAKVVTGVLVHGAGVAVQPRRELQMWKDLHALAGHDDAERIGAITKLIGSVAAAGQIEGRFIRRFRILLERRRAMTAGHAQLGSS